MSLREYASMYEESSKNHYYNVMSYGPSTPFGYPDILPEQSRRIKFIVANSEGLILDVGCDSGYILDLCGGGVGVDLSHLRIKAARRWYPGLYLVQGLAEYLPFREDVFDTTILAEILEHVQTPEEVLEETHRVSRDGGGVVVTVPNEITGRSHENPEHLRRFTKKGITGLLKRFFLLVWNRSIRGDYPSWCFRCEVAK